MNVLVLSPHTDDGEFGCGGSVARFIKEGAEVFYAAFSIARKSVPPKFPADILRTEVKEATRVLGIKEAALILFDYEVREFPASRQKILEDIIRLGEDIKPDIVLLPSTHDTHQDHQVIAQEGFRAFKETTMLGYEVTRNNLSFPTSAFIRLSRTQLRQKIEAVECYRSQKGKQTMSVQFIKQLAGIRGAQIGVEYAEAFEAIRWVMG